MLRRLEEKRRRRRRRRRRRGKKEEMIRVVKVEQVLKLRDELPEHGIGKPFFFQFHAPTPSARCFCNNHSLSLSLSLSPPRVSYASLSHPSPLTHSSCSTLAPTFQLYPYNYFILFTAMSSVPYYYRLLSPTICHNLSFYVSAC